MSNTMHDSRMPVSIGCPVWSCPDWKGSVYPPNAPKHSWLKYYSQTFNTVEGNSSFYGIPAPDTFRRWASETADGFEFCFKFPKAISHDCRLIGAEQKTEQFLDGLGILHSAQRLGPTFLQLGPDFSPTQFPSLAKYLKALPREFPFAVEVRNQSWFDQPTESEFNSLLTEIEMDRVIFDSRPLYSAPPTDEYEAASQGRKPKSPLRQMATANRPMLRLIGRNDVDSVGKWINEWVPVIAGWISEGRRPYLFGHTPNEAFAPGFCRRIHEALATNVKAMDSFGDWPFESQNQMELF